MLLHRPADIMSKFVLIFDSFWVSTLQLCSWLELNMINNHYLNLFLHNYTFEMDRHSTEGHTELRKLIVGIESSQRSKSIGSLTERMLLFAPVKTKHAWLISTNALQFRLLRICFN